MREAVAAAALLLPFAMGAAGADAGPRRHEVFTFADPAIVESSGLAVVDGRFVTVNDSGDTARVFTVDPRTGRTVGTTTWPADVVDVEAVAPAGAGEVWVGDLGDNTGSRDTVTVTRVPVGPGPHEATGPSYELTYPGGARDAETLLVEPRTGRLLVASKGVLGGMLYAAPRRLSSAHPNRLRPVGPVLPIATDGAFFPDGRHLVVRNYSGAVVYSWPELEAVGEVTLPHQRQGEGIAVDDRGRVFVSSEGMEQPVLRVPLPARLAAELAPAATPSASPSASPSAAPSDSPTTVSREGRELPEEPSGGRDPWQWLLGTGVLLAALVVLLRALRPR